MTAEGCRLFYKHRLLQMFVNLLHLFFWVENNRKNKVYIHADKCICTQPERQSPHTLLRGGGIAVHKWQHHSPFLLQGVPIKPFSLHSPGWSWLMPHYRENLCLKHFQRLLLKFLSSHVLQPTKPSCYSSHVEAVLETLKPVKVIEMNHSIFQGVMNLRQDILQSSWLLNTTISVHAWGIQHSCINWKPRLLAVYEIKLSV